MVECKHLIKTVSLGISTPVPFYSHAAEKYVEKGEGHKVYYIKNDSIETNYSQVRIFIIKNTAHTG